MNKITLVSFSRHEILVKYRYEQNKTNKNYLLQKLKEIGAEEKTFFLLINLLPNLVLRCFSVQTRIKKTRQHVINLATNLATQPISLSPTPAIKDERSLR